MKNMLALAILVATTAAASADGYPQPQPRPYDVHGSRPVAMSSQRTFRVVMPNGRMRQCVVTNRFQKGRGMVHTRSCWRIR